ncbi:MAG: hypothetical protein V1738_05125 [Patescibacteria group bacterium]
MSMKIERHNRQYILFFAVFTAIGVSAAVFSGPLWLRGMLTVLYVLGNGYLIGWLSMPKEWLSVKILIGSLLNLAALMVVGSGIYYLHRLDLVPTIAAIVFAPLLALTLAGLNNHFTKNNLVQLPADNQIKAAPKKSVLIVKLIGLALSIAAAALAVYGLDLLGGSVTDLSIRSPWDDVPRLFFIILFMTATATLGLTVGRIAGAAALLPLVGLSFLTTSVAVIIYSVGFGFDPFIHQATETHIFDYGVMLPKPLYYLGQYSLVTILARMLGGFVTSIDTWLVPIAFSFVTPVAFWSMRRSFNWDGPLAATACLPLLALPLSSLIVTTPQGLANALLLSTVFVLLVSATTDTVPRWIPVFLALATTAVHPLAGVPLLIFTIMIAYLRATESIRRMPEVRWAFFIKLFIIACVALPVMFIVNARLSGTDVTLDQETIRTPTAIIEELKNPTLETRRFSAVLDFVYYWRTTRTAAFVVLSFLGAVLFWLVGRSNENQRQREIAIAFGAGALAFFVNYVLLRAWVKFPFLIDYEQTNYADRLAELALFVSAPLALYAFGRLWQRVRRHGFPTMTVGLILLMAAIVTANAYLAYPRRDKYESSRGWSTSAADVKAVQTIDNDSAGNEYIVLANQSVSAAAIRELGFKKYFASTSENETEPIFFYPIPTGGPLYQIYLETNDSFGDRTVVEQAMDLTGANSAYYVVNHYWWQAQQIIIKAKKDADAWWPIDDKIWVFKYER